MGQRTRKEEMKKLIIGSALIALFSFAAMAETKSDYDRSYDFLKLRTWDFKAFNRMPTDPVATNSLWNQRIRRGLEVHFAQIGYKRIDDGEPDFLLGYFMGIKQKYDIRYIDYGFPGRMGMWGRWGRWYGWEPGRTFVDVWRIPYNESTLVVDVIDPHTNQLVWRGYDTATIDFDKSEKTIHKSIENLAKRFRRDVNQQKKRVR
jgi:hypothetical protein